jgi:hypothetical protein
MDYCSSDADPEVSGLSKNQNELKVKAFILQMIEMRYFIRNQPLDI